MDASPGPTPELSIVVVPFGGKALLERCLAALEAQTARAETEILVSGDPSHDFAELAHRYPAVRFERSAERRTWAELRADAVSRSGAPIVALTEAQCEPDREWARRTLAAHQADHAAVGGVVEKTAGTITGWALYFCDYARYAPPLPRGPAAALTDCNVSYKRAALDEVAEHWEGEFHEPTIHAALIGRGGTLWLAPDLVVRHLRSPGLGEAISDRFRFGRLFGATRATMTRGARLWLLALAAPLVPPMIVGRAVVDMMRRRRQLGRLVLALPAMTLLAAVWALGELVGTVSGRAGALAAEEPSTGATA